MSNLVKVEEHTAVETRQEMTPMGMIGRALEMGLSADILKQMMDLRDREDAKQARRAFDAAIAKAKAEIKPIYRNATGHNNKSYSDFSAIADAVDGILSSNGLHYRFKTAQTDRINVTCILAHEEGHSEETTLSGPPDATGSKNAIQAIGSTLSYLQRYSLVAALGLASARDDDGKAAGLGNAKAISREQIKIILDLIEDTETDTEQFCRAVKIDAIPNLLVSDFNSVVGMLNQKKAKMKGAAA